MDELYVYLHSQSSRQAKVSRSLRYTVLKTIPLKQRVYVFDISLNQKRDLGISVVKNGQSLPVRFYSPYGLYIALQDETLICATKDSVLKGGAIFWPVLRTYNNPLILAAGCSPVLGYTPQGITVCKSGDILVCLWNNEIGDRSLGKVISVIEDFQISTDKNHPLYICPTYIAENGNGDICVSDVRAVVVTDAGGMLRFRYQGNSSAINFDPYGICCDSKCNIIVADMKNDTIHMVAKDGTFLYHVTYNGIKMPRAICIDQSDNVYVGEWDTDVIKVISR